MKGCQVTALLTAGEENLCAVSLPGKSNSSALLFLAHFNKQIAAK